MSQFQFHLLGTKSIQKNDVKSVSMNYLISQEDRIIRVRKEWNRKKLEWIGILIDEYLHFVLKVKPVLDDVTHSR